MVFRLKYPLYFSISFFFFFLVCYKTKARYQVCCYKIREWSLSWRMMLVSSEKGITTYQMADTLINVGVYAFKYPCKWVWPNHKLPPYRFTTIYKRAEATTSTLIIRSREKRNSHLNMCSWKRRSPEGFLSLISSFTFRHT